MKKVYETMVYKVELTEHELRILQFAMSKLVKLVDDKTISLPYEIGYTDVKVLNADVSLIG